MPKNDSRSIIGYFTAGILIYLAQTHLLWNSGFLDYDSARNWQIVQEISKGNFEHLFQHASPTFFLFYACFTPIFPDFHYFILLNCFINSLAILLTGRFIAQKFNLSTFPTFLLLLFTGLSCYLTANGRYFTIEAPSLLLFSILLPLYYQRFTQNNQKALLQVAALLAIGLTINYKFLLLVPIACILEFIYADKLLQSRNLIYIGLILLVPFLFYSVVALLVNLPFYRFPAVYFTIIYNYQVPNPSSRVGFFNLDLFFYLQYFRQFESPLILGGILFYPFLFRRQIFVKTRKFSITLYGYLFWVVYPILGGMHLLQKAPRGLFLIYSLLYALTFISSLKLIRSKILVAGLFCFSVFYQTFVLQREIYAYSSTNYPKVIAYLNKHKIDRIATCVGLGITPYARKENIKVITVFNELQLSKLKALGYRYVLLDDYYLAANIQNFKNLEKISPLAIWAEPSLMSPYLYLDQSEFTGFTYRQALQLRQQAVQDSIQLRLLPIP